MENNIKKQNNTALITIPLIILFIFFGVFFNQPTSVILESLKDRIAYNFGWFYIFSISAILIFVVYLAFSKYGKIRLSEDYAEPQFSYIAWISMLFSAGMGIGLVFWGVGEPIKHFIEPLQSDPKSIAAAREAMNTTFFHWGVHQWAIYVVTALSISYFAYRYNKPLAFKTMLYPVFGEKITHNLAGNFIDSLAIIGTLFGIATSLGFGAMQINSGLQYVFDIPKNITITISIIFVLSIIATISAATGIKRGVKILSESNLWLSIFLMLFFLFFGSTIFILNSFVQTLGNYPKILIEKSFWTDAFKNRDWVKDWTIFYWAWVLSWAPFVGIFIARISFGRTIREFIGGVLIVPVLITFLWISIFGGTALDLELHQGITSISAAVQNDVSTAIFNIAHYLPFNFFISTIFLVVIAVYFVTSCDSGVLVINALVSGQYLHSSIYGRIFWGLAIGTIAALLMSFGGLKALQIATIIIALPFLLVIILGCFGLLKFMKRTEKNL
jgi:choline/glycine/proline betaine transport protein